MDCAAAFNRSRVGSSSLTPRVVVAMCCPHVCHFEYGFSLSAKINGALSQVQPGTT
jgi:hypothetical protein